MRFLNQMAIFGFLVFWALYPYEAFSQWSADSLINLAVADTIGEQSVPKIAGTSDGGCFISWYDNRDGNYGIYLQKLNAAGEKQWAENGLAVSTHPQETWVTDYDLSVDSEDNAIVVFNDIRNGGTSGWDIFAYKISPGGDFIWGPDGLGLSDLTITDAEMAPKVAVTSENHVVVAWNKSGDIATIALQKISANGILQWGDYGITLQGAVGESLQNVILAAADNDSVIALWKNSSGPYWAPVTHLYAQKFDPDGNSAWDSAGVIIYDEGNISAWTWPQIIPDEAGGAIFCWYDSPSLSEFYVKIQHVDNNGNILFPANGIYASTNTSRLHMNPSVSYASQTQNIYVFWKETDGNQDFYGIYGQKISPAGERLWTDDGYEYLPLTSDPVSFVTCRATDIGIYVSYFVGSGPTSTDDAVHTFLTNETGENLWGPRIVSAHGNGNKDDLEMIVNTGNSLFMTWSDHRNASMDIYAQNINPDGSLGNGATPLEDQPVTPAATFHLKQNYPNPFNPKTGISYRLLTTGMVNLTIYNTMGQEVRQLVNKKQSPGLYRLEWDGKNNSAIPTGSGVYLLRMHVNGQAKTMKMIMLK